MIKKQKNILEVGYGEDFPFFRSLEKDEVIFKNFFGDPRTPIDSREFVFNIFNEALRVLKEKGKLIIIETYTPIKAKKSFF